jgi:RHS repeat-associated protein
VPITLDIDLTVNAVGTETITYLHTDGLGSPVAKSNASGVRISQTKYEAYGMTVAGSDQTTIGFTGHYNDKDTELTYMQQRYYDPVAGRFLSTDPVLTNANTGASFNRYVYANNNSYKFIDPDGRDNFTVTGNVTGVLGVGGEAGLGVYVSFGKGVPFDIGITASVGAGAGWNVGAGVSFGYVPGPTSNIAGTTLNTNVSAPIISGAVMVDAKTNDFNGIQAGFGAKLGVSQTISNGQTRGVRDLISWVKDKFTDSKKDKQKKQEPKKQEPIIEEGPRWYFK